MKSHKYRNAKIWITCFLFGMILLGDRMDSVLLGKEHAHMFFDYMAIRYDVILSRGLSFVIQRLFN